MITRVTGGVGFELAKILYQKNGKIYIVARSAKKVNKAIENIKEQSQGSNGRLEARLLDLADLTYIKPAVRRVSGEKNYD